MMTGTNAVTEWCWDQVSREKKRVSLGLQQLWLVTRYNLRRKARGKHEAVRNDLVYAGLLR